MKTRSIIELTEMQLKIAVQEFVERSGHTCDKVQLNVSEIFDRYDDHCGYIVNAKAEISIELKVGQHRKV